MRIISGEFKGRMLKGHNLKNTRPTMDRVKESLFAIINNDIKDSTCLDIFAGTGSLGFEAISQGAKKVIFIDNDKESIKIIKENSKMLKVNNIEIIKEDYIKALNYLGSKNNKFNLIFIDPPYSYDIIEEVISILILNKLLAKNALIVYEHELEINLNALSKYNVVTTKKYGDTKITIFKID